MTGGNPRYAKARRHVLADLDLKSILTPADPNEVWCGVKVLCTLGPSCHDEITLCHMLEAGMTVARVDLTWGPLQYHMRSLELLQRAMKRVHRQCAIMVDTVGREIMIRRPYTLDANGWPFHEFDLTFSAGQNVVVTVRDVPASPQVLPITYDKFPSLVGVGDTIYCGRYLNCGAPDQASLYLQVLEVGQDDVLCRAVNDAVLSGLITIFIAEPTEGELTAPQSDLPLLTVYDAECLTSIAAAYEVDFVATSFTRSGSEVADARRQLGSLGLGAAEVVAKIETRGGVFNFKGILEQADAIVLSRGNLGMDIPPEKQAGLQKALIAACNVAGKPCLVTRGLDSMGDAPRPTRSEATDVANIVLDGADGLFLGAETLRGLYPVETVRMAVSIARQAEHVFDYHHNFDYLMRAALGAQQAEAAAEEEFEELGARSPMLEDLDLYRSCLDDPHDPTGGPSGAATPGAPHHRRGGVSSSFDPSAPRHTHSDLNSVVAAMTRFGVESSHRGGVGGGGSFAPGMSRHGGGGGGGGGSGGMPRTSSFLGGGMHRSPTQARIAQSLYLKSPYLSKLESIASSAVRAAEKVGASLIVVFTHTARAPQLVAKYRPPMPILTLVVPRLTSDGLHWKLEGRHHARQCMMTRGLMPMLTAPGPSGEEVLEEAISTAAKLGLVRPHAYVVVLERINDAFCVKIVAVDELGLGIKRPGRGCDTDAATARANLPAAPVVGRTSSMGICISAAGEGSSATAGYGGGGGVLGGASASPLQPRPPQMRGFLGRTTSTMEELSPKWGGGSRYGGGGGSVFGVGGAFGPSSGFEDPAGYGSVSPFVVTSSETPESLAALFNEARSRIAANNAAAAAADNEATLSPGAVAVPRGGRPTRRDTPAVLEAGSPRSHLYGTRGGTLSPRNSVSPRVSGGGNTNFGGGLMATNYPAAAASPPSAPAPWPPVPLAPQVVPMAILLPVTSQGGFAPVAEEEAGEGHAEESQQDMEQESGSRNNGRGGNNGGGGGGGGGAASYAVSSHSDDEDAGHLLTPPAASSPLATPGWPTVLRPLSPLSPVGSDTDTAGP